MNKPPKDAKTNRSQRRWRRRRLVIGDGLRHRSITSDTFAYVVRRVWRQKLLKQDLRMWMEGDGVNMMTNHPRISLVQWQGKFQESGNSLYRVVHPAFGHLWETMHAVKNSFYMLNKTCFQFFCYVVEKSNLMYIVLFFKSNLSKMTSSLYYVYKNSLKTLTRS